MFFASIAVLTVVGAAYCILARWLRGAFASTSELILAAIPLGGALFASFAALGMLVLPTGAAGVAAFVAVASGGIWAGISLWRRGDGFVIPLASGKPRAGAVLFIGVSVLVLLFGALTVLSLAPSEDGSYTVGAGAAGDVFYHLAQVTRIAFTTHWDFEEPNFSGEFIGYPFFVNLLSAMLLKLGAPFAFAFHAPTLLLGAAAIALFALFLRKLGVSESLVLAALGGTLFASSLGYIAYFSGMQEFGLLTRHTVPYPMQAIAYPAFLPTFLVAQRAFVFGLGLFLLVLMGIIRGIGIKAQGSFVLAGIAMGFLPLAHTHSFIAAGVVSGVVLVYLILWRDDLFFAFCRGTLFPAFFLALPQIAAFVLLPRFNSVPFLTFRIGWLSDPREVLAVRTTGPDAWRLFPWMRFFWTNFGVLLSLPFFLLSRVRRFGPRPALAVLGGGALALWIVPNLVQFHAWDVNMNKLFGYAILLSFAGGVVAVHELASRARMFGVLALWGVVLLSAPSAFISITYFLRTPRVAAVRVFAPDAQATATWIRTHTPEDAAFVSSGFLPRRDLIQSEAVVFAGRKSPLGPIVWVYTHGIDPTERLEAIDAFLKEPKRGPELSSRLRAEYLLVDDALRTAYPGLDERVERAGFPMLFQAGELRIVGLEIDRMNRRMHKEPPRVVPTIQQGSGLSGSWRQQAVRPRLGFRGGRVLRGSHPGKVAR